MSPDDYRLAKSNANSTITTSSVKTPSRMDAEEAIRTLIRWIGDDAEREGLIDTPKRVARAYQEMFNGYGKDPIAILERTFEETDNYNEIILLRDIRIESFCEHHMLPIIGRAHIAYIPNGRVVGISKLARTLEIFSKRLQIQEKLTSQVANTINVALRPKGVAVAIDAQHECMTTRGVHKPGVSMVTKCMLGCFKEEAELRQEFLSLIGNST